MKYYAYYPGCSTEATATGLEASAQAISQPLGIELKEIEDWTCCGSTPYGSLDREEAVVVASRNLALAEKTGLDLEKVEIINPTFRNEDLIEGKMDAMLAYVSDQPFWFQRRGVPVNIIDPRDYGIDFYGDNLFTTEGEIEKNPERVEKIIRATLKGWEYALANPDEIIDTILNRI